MKPKYFARAAALRPASGCLRCQWASRRFTPRRPTLPRHASIATPAGWRAGRSVDEWTVDEESGDRVPDRPGVEPPTVAAPRAVVGQSSSNAHRACPPRVAPCHKGFRARTRTDTAGPVVQRKVFGIQVFQRLPAVTLGHRRARRKFDDPAGPAARNRRIGLSRKLFKSYGHGRSLLTSCKESLPERSNRL